MPFKSISYLELWQPFCSVELTIHANQEEQFCENILKLGLWFRRRCCLKDFISGALVTLLISAARPFKYAILKEGIMGNIRVNLYEIRTSGSRGDVV